MRKGVPEINNACGRKENETPLNDGSKKPAEISFIDQLPVALHDRSCGRADRIRHG